MPLINAAGGDATIKKLADLMGVAATPLDSSQTPAIKRVAYIREDECIGCTKCIQACPVDAIVGASKQMHTVIVDECTGCDLCVEPCPVNCIDMVPLPGTVEQQMGFTGHSGTGDRCKSGGDKLSAVLVSAN